jgi:hypothetical protein
MVHLTWNWMFVHSSELSVLRLELSLLCTVGSLVYLDGHVPLHLVLYHLCHLCCNCIDIPALDASLTLHHFGLVCIHVVLALFSSPLIFCLDSFNIVVFVHCLCCGLVL